MLNFTVPNLTVTISVINPSGSVRSTHDISSAVTSIEINHEQQTNLSGLLPWSGRLEVNRAHTINNLSLNPRDMSSSPKGAAIWAKGSKVDVYIADSFSNLKRFWPSLYIISQPSGFPLMSCELVDELALKTYQQPEGDLTGIELGSTVDRGTVVRSILSNFTSLSVSGSVPGNLSAPIQKVDQSAFAEQAGAIAWTASQPQLVWVDKTNTIQLDSFNLRGGSTAFTVDVTTEMAEFEELNSDERPNIVRVVGNRSEVSEITYPRCSENKAYDGRKTTQIERTCKDIQGSLGAFLSSGIKQITNTKRWFPKNEVNPEEDFFETLVFAEDITETTKYRSSDGRYQETTLTEKRALGLCGFELPEDAADPDVHYFINWYNIITAVEETTRIEYGLDDVIRKRIRKRYGLKPSIDPDATNPVDDGTRLLPVQEEIETWTRISKSEWEYYRVLKETRVFVSTVTRNGETTESKRYRLVLSESERKSGAEANPPQTAYYQGEFRSEEVQHAGEAEFQSLSGESLDQIRVIGLPGGMAESDSQCQQLAKYYGALIYGRSLGIVGQIEILNWLLNSYKPYARWHLNDVDGTTTAYWLDGVSIRIEGNRRGYVQIAGAEIGIVDAADTPITRYQTYDLVVANGTHTIYLNDSINYTIEEQATIVLGGSIFLEGETVLSGGSIYLEGETVTSGSIVYLEVLTEDDMGIPAVVICGDGTGGIPACSYAGSGKILEFSGTGTFYLSVYLDFDYVPTNTLLRISKWDTAPTSAQTGRTWDQDIDMSGLVGGDFVGHVLLTVNATYQWFDFQEYDYLEGYSDSICFRLEGSTLSLMGV